MLCHTPAILHSTGKVVGRDGRMPRKSVGGSCTAHKESLLHQGEELVPPKIVLTLTTSTHTQHTFTHIHTHTHMNAHMCAHTHALTYRHMHMYTHSSSHTHTHTQVKVKGINHNGPH